MLQRSVEKQFAAFRRGFLRVSKEVEGRAGLLLADGWLQSGGLWLASALSPLWHVPAACRSCSVAHSKPPYI